MNKISHLTMLLGFTLVSISICVIIMYYFYRNLKKSEEKAATYMDILVDMYRSDRNQNRSDAPSANTSHQSEATKTKQGFIGIDWSINKNQSDLPSTSILNQSENNTEVHEDQVRHYNTEEDVKEAYCRGEIHSAYLDDLADGEYQASIRNSTPRDRWPEVWKQIGY